MPKPIRTILTGPNLPTIDQPRGSAPSTITKKTLADFTRVVEQTDILKPDKSHNTPALTRRQIPGRPDCWTIHYGDVRVGTIGRRDGVPVDRDPWGWHCGFYPGSELSDDQDGTAATFDVARAEFEAAWAKLLSTRTEDHFRVWRENRDSRAWLDTMHDAGLLLPTQVPEGRSRCFCGAEITIDGADDHIRNAHRLAQKP